MDVMAGMYRVVVGAYGALIGISAWLGNAKARQWVAGRRGWRERWAPLDVPQGIAGPLLWMHCASLGEFEQGRPVIEALRREVAGLRVVLTFFSPSGYEVRKDYAQADRVLYLPLDSPEAARDFIERVRPTLAVFVKYELWYFLLRELRNRGIPCALIAAHLQRGRGYDAPLARGWYRRVVGLLDWVFTQEEAGAEVARQLGAQQVAVAGDPRFDRVVSIAETAEPVAQIAEWIADRPCLVAGSVWPPDIALIEQASQLLYQKTGQRLAVIWAPHVTSAELVNREFISKHGGVSYADLPTGSSEHFLWIDRVGLLSRLYAHGDLCYVGGGYGAGVHNTLEAAVWGRRVLFGPRYGRFREAVGLIATDGARAVSSAEELAAEFEQVLTRPEAVKASGQRAAAYVKAHTGATATIVSALMPLLRAKA